MRISDWSSDVCSSDLLFLSRRDWPFRLRDAAALESLRWSTTRRRVHQNLTVLAVDHRSQFEDLAAELGVGLDRVACFKRLALDALDRVAGDCDEFGILLDGRFGDRKSTLLNSSH